MESITRTSWTGALLALLAGSSWTMLGATALGQQASPTPPADAARPTLDLEARVAELEQRLAELEQAPVTPAPAHQTIHAEATHTTPEGFWKLPGTDFSMKLGGYVKLDVIHDFQELGNRYKFSTQSIAVPTETDSVTTIHARESRLSFDLRGPTAGHELRVFVEGDFFGSGDTFELRHAFGSLGGLLAGQTWTTYMDLSSRPSTLDFEGPDGEIFVRQPMVRWTQGMGARSNFSVAIEDSTADIGSASGASEESSTSMPDLAANVRLEGEGRHAQLSGVLRYLEVDGSAGSPDEEELGWGVALSAKTQLGAAGRRLMGQVGYGEGSAHYNQATRGSGSDAVLEPGGLETLPVLTAVAGYEHDWSEQWSSTLALALAELDNRDSQPADAIHRSRSASLNLVWHPYPRFLVGAEYLYGERENRDGEEGEAHRVQISFKFLF